MLSLFIIFFYVLQLAAGIIIFFLNGVLIVVYDHRSRLPILVKNIHNTFIQVGHFKLTFHLCVFIKILVGLYLPIDVIAFVERLSARVKIFKPALGGISFGII